jgi:hypothetical protein
MNPAGASAAHNEGSNNNNVVVKVSARASFGQLVDSKIGYLWNHGSSKRSPSWGMVCRCLVPSLHGIYSTEDRFGLVQIMPDLFSIGFQPLHPRRLKEINQWGHLWTAFETFVQGTLIPLAEAAIIHPDLRPGFNCTANLLYHPGEEEIRMVDLDSLVEFALWGQSNPVGHRYISIARKARQRKVRSALDFLFKQVVVIAEAWIQAVDDGDAVVDDLFHASLAARNWTSNESRVCDAAFILDVLRGYRSQFGA